MTFFSSESVTIHTVLVALIRVMCTPLIEPNPKVPIEGMFLVLGGCVCVRPKMGIVLREGAKGSRVI